MKVQVTFDTAPVSALRDIEGAVAIVYQEDRPLIGAAVRADWRLNGFLSRLVMSGRFTGSDGEWLLVSTQGRLDFSHLFLVGMGKRGEPAVERAKRCLRGVAAKVALSGIHKLAIDLCELRPSGLQPNEALAVFLEALSTAYPDDELSDPPYRPAHEAQERNSERLEVARKRREQLIEARERWVDEHLGEGPGPLDGPPRPVAGGLDDDAEAEEEASAVSDPPALPPDPDSLPQPELEPSPERTVHVILLGDPEAVRGMRAELRRLREGGGEINVDFLA